jgi:hypothetical protein
LDARPKNIWVVKARVEHANGEGGWDWDEYFFRDPDKADEPYEWGGSTWINSPASKKHIREDVKKGDLVVCYRVDDREIVGFTTMASDGYEETLGSGQFNLFKLAPPNDAFPLLVLPTINDLHAHDCRPKCFGPGTQGTVFSVEPDEFACIVKVINSERSSPKLVLSLWLQWAGWEEPATA